MRARVLSGAVAVMALCSAAQLTSGPRRFGSGFSPRSGEQVLAGGAQFQHYRVGHEFRLPDGAAVRLARRGSFYEVRGRDTARERFMFYGTSFLIRRENELRHWEREVFGPCAAVLPTSREFQVVKTCVFRARGNNLERHVRIVRRAEYLHLFYAVYRVSYRARVQSMLKSLKLYGGFVPPAQPTR